MSFSMVPGMTLEQMQRVMGQSEAEAPAVPPLQQETELRPVAKKLRPKADKPET
jgi:hypothetical protein